MARWARSRRAGGSPIYPSVRVYCRHLLPSSFFRRGGNRFWLHFTCKARGTRQSSVKLRVFALQLNWIWNAPRISHTPYRALHPVTPIFNFVLYKPDVFIANSFEYIDFSVNTIGVWPQRRKSRFAKGGPFCGDPPSKHGWNKAK